jgi:uncharacterized membrane protein
MFDLGYEFYYSMFEGYGSSPMWSDWAGFMEHMSPSGGGFAETYADITARNAMLVFIILAGITQLFFIYPLAKFYSVDGEVSKDLKPTILALMLFGLVALVYEIPQIAVGIGSLAVFPTEYFLLIVGLVVVWFFFAVLLLKSRMMKKIADSTESSYMKTLNAEIKKEK